MIDITILRLSDVAAVEEGCNEAVASHRLPRPPDLDPFDAGKVFIDQETQIPANTNGILPRLAIDVDPLSDPSVPRNLRLEEVIPVRQFLDLASLLHRHLELDLGEFAHNL